MPGHLKQFKIAVVLLLFILGGLGFYLLLPKKVKAMNVESKIEDQVAADIFPLPDIPEPSAITRAGHYILLTHISSSLTELDAVGHLQGAVAKSWQMEDDHKKFVFKIKEGLKFSDGSPLTSKDVVGSLQRQLRSQTSVHFDFKKVRAVHLNSDSEVVIELKSSEPHFIYEVAKPEFAILSPEDQLAKENACTFSKSSGPYSLVKMTEQRAELRRNEFFQGLDPLAPKLLIIKHSDLADQLAQMQSGALSFFVPTEAVSADMHSTLVSNPKIRATIPHIGFTYWIRLNPNSKYLSDRLTRRWLQQLLDPRQIDMKHYAPLWEQAVQLYLPEGSGRLTKAETDAFWNKVSMTVKPAITPTVLRMIRPDFPLKEFDLLLKKLNENGIKVTIIDYASDKELQKLIKSGEFELSVSSNDFSSTDLSENIKVTFNGNRPYISLEPTSPIHTLLDKMNRESDSEKLSLIYHAIAVELLESAYIVPLAHNRVVFYHRKNLDISAWSQLFPEIAFGKARLTDE